MKDYFLELSWYEKEEDHFVAAAVVNKQFEQEIKKILDIPLSNPLTDAYIVTSMLADFLNHHVEHNIDICSFDYFIEVSHRISL